jgi:hypothetical protein
VPQILEAPVAAAREDTIVTWLDDVVGRQVKALPDL